MSMTTGEAITGIFPIAQSIASKIFRGSLHRQVSCRRERLESRQSIVHRGTVTMPLRYK